MAALQCSLCDMPVTVCMFLTGHTFDSVHASIGMFAPKGRMSQFAEA